MGGRGAVLMWASGAMVTGRGYAFRAHVSRGGINAGSAAR